MRQLTGTIKDANEIYDHFDSLEWEDAYLFLSDLLQNYPNKDLSVMTSHGMPIYF